MQTEKDMQNSENFNKQNGDSFKKNGHSSRKHESKLAEPIEISFIEKMVIETVPDDTNRRIDNFIRFVLPVLIGLRSKPDVPSGLVEATLRGLMVDLCDCRAIVRKTAALALGEIANSPSLQFGLMQNVLLTLAQATEDIDSRVCLTAAEAGIKILSAIQI